MEKPVFENLKKFEYGGIKLSEVASWAVWDKQDIENTKVIEENIENLNGEIVFVALNFSRERKVWEDWQNFHCDGRGDKRLRDLLSGTKYQGAYMTDLIKNYHDANADEAKKEFKHDEKKRDKDIDFLFKEIELLGTENIEMYLFGGDLEELFEDYVMKHNDIEKFKQKVIKCQRIHHFSPQVTDFEAVASLQLGLSDKTKQLEKKWKYDPLWNRA